MIRMRRFAARPAPPGATALLLLLLLLASAAACGPGPAESGLDAGALALTGGIVYDGAAAVECGPAAPRTFAEPVESEQVAVGRVEPDAGEAPVARRETAAGERPGDEAGEARGEADPRFDVTLTPSPTAGFAVTLHLPPHGATVRAPVVVAAIDDDGTYRQSTGTAEVHLDKGSQLTRSAATRHVSGRFTGSYRGEAGDGELAGRFTRCFYFD